MCHTRILHRLLVALLTSLVLVPIAGQPLPAAAASPTFAVTSMVDTHDANAGDGICADAAHQCTLRAAIEEANAQSSGSPITVTVPADRYELTLGALAVLSNTVVISGTGAGTTVLDAQRHSQVLIVGRQAGVVLAGVVVTEGAGGADNGGGLANAGTAILRDSVLTDNSASQGGGVYNAPGARLWVLDGSVISSNTANGPGGGGGIANTGSMTLTQSTISSNIATGPGGGIANTGSMTLTQSAIVGNTAPGGGGIANSGGGMTLTQSTVGSNTANGPDSIDNSGGGIANTGDMTLTQSAIVTNTTSGGGGGIANTGTMTLTQSAIVSNMAGHGDGGGIANTGSMMLTQSAAVSNTTSGGGGGIANTGGMTLTQSAIGGNTATGPGGGGGIANTGTMTLTQSAIVTNTAPGGGGIANSGGSIANTGGMTLTQSAIVGNTANGPGGGGGIANTGGMTLTQSTISSNTANGPGGGVYNDQAGGMTLTQSAIVSNTAPGGGGIDNSGGGMTLTNSALTSNTASPLHGGAIYAESGGAVALWYDTVAFNSSGIDTKAIFGPATVALTGTIVANSTSGPNCTGPITEVQGYNLDSGTTCGFKRPVGLLTQHAEPTDLTNVNLLPDLTNVNPVLGPLALSDGPPPMAALLPGSPAIDHGGTSANGCPATDLRGVARPQGRACDIGAFEGTPPTDLPVPATDTPIPPSVPPTDTPIPPTAAPANTPAPPAATATNVPIAPLATPTRVAGQPTLAPTSAPVRPTATPVTRAVCVSHKAPPLTVRVAQHSVVSGNTLALRASSAPHTRVSLALQVTTTKVTITGTGKHRKRVKHTVVLYQITRQGTTDAHGRFTSKLKVTYKPAKAARAGITITARTACGTGTRRAQVMITPPRSLPLTVGLSRYSVTSGGVLSVSIRTVAHAHISVTLQVTTTKMVTGGAGKHRKKIRQTVVLYHVARQGRADAHGRFMTRLRVTYKPARPVQAHLIVSARTAHGTVAHTALVSLQPPRHQAKPRR